MTSARRILIDAELTPFYHIKNRCVEGLFCEERISSQVKATSYLSRDNSGEYLSVASPEAGTCYVAVRGRSEGVINGELTIRVK